MVSTARDIQIQAAVTVGIEEQGAPVIEGCVGHPRLAWSGGKAAAPLVNEHLRRDA